jgi:EAL domain-containing protein (putative c-di-GMP-specific phosphodiesterase class I)
MRLQAHARAATVKARAFALYPAGRRVLHTLWAGRHSGAPGKLWARKAGWLRLGRSANLTDDLRHAMLRDDLHLEYQPISCVVTGRIVAFEALLRWNHQVRGAVAPGSFIPAAEESGAIVALGKWVLRKACAEAAAWPMPYTLAVNISPVQFRDPRIIAAIASILAETGLAPERLLLEITEGQQLFASDRVRNTLQRLRGLGIGIALDDFGAGYANLSRMRNLPFDVIKFDRSFLDQRASPTTRLDMLSPLVSFVRAFGAKIVMEGVETPEQLELVQTLGCDWVQGFFLSRPVSPAALRPLMRTNQQLGATASARTAVLA